MFSRFVFVAFALFDFSLLLQVTVVTSETSVSDGKISTDKDSDVKRASFTQLSDEAAPQESRSRSNSARSSAQQNSCQSDSCGGQWFSNRLMRNAGLVNDVASSADECVKRCYSSWGCSGVSYQPASGTCLRSTCNNLDLYQSTGWSSFVMNVSFVEGVHLPAAQFEWMLTDTCGALNQGVAGGPKMNLYSVTYTPSLSVSAGRAALFAGTTTSYGISDNDTRLNNVLGKSSHTVMFWVNWSHNPTINTFLEYGSGQHRSFIFWLYAGGIFYDILNPHLMGQNMCSSSCSRVHAFKPAINTWYHVAYVYDGSEGTMTVYVNGKLLGFDKLGIVPNNRILDVARVAYTPFTQEPLRGNLYCLKVLNAAVTLDQVSAFANSCIYGKIRLSN